MKPVADLIPYARNARTHSDEQVAQIAGSIREFGFNNPVLIDESGTIIAGHGRVMAARKLGMKDVPTITLSHLNDSQRRAYILADNKLALNAGWDDEMLKAELDALAADSFELTIAGWDEKELKDISSFSDEREDKNPKEDKKEELNKKWKVKLGDRYQIGENHFLICSDSFNSETWQGKKFDLCFTDPPFEIEAQKITDLCFSLSKQAIVCGCGPEYHRLAAQKGVKFCFETISIRNAPRSLPTYTGPFILHWGTAFLTQGEKHVFHSKNAKSRFGNGDYYPSVRGPYECGENECGYSKPVEWAEEILSMCSGISTVCDPFMCSGTSIIAAEKRSLSCFGCEIDPLNVAVSLERFEEFGLSILKL